MEKDKVYFLGEEYEFPHELYEYVIYCRQFQNDREQLLTTMFNRMQNHVYSFPDAELERMLRDACRNTIRYLAKAGIYDQIISLINSFRNSRQMQHSNCLCLQNSLPRNIMLDLIRLYEMRLLRLQGQGIRSYLTAF